MRIVPKFVHAYTHEDLICQVARRATFPLRSRRINRYVFQDLHYKDMREWALWTPEMDFPRMRGLPPNVRYIGPCLDFKRADRPIVIEKGVGVDWLVYVSVGTVRYRWKENVAFLRRVVQAFDQISNIMVIVSTGDKRTTEAIGQTPENVKLHDFVPQLSVLGVADLAITHAGSGTLRECIINEVPMLAYPRNSDQFGNSARIVYHGIGLRGRRRWDSATTIRRKTVQILEDHTFRANISRLKRSVQHYDDRLLREALRDAGL